MTSLPPNADELVSAYLDGEAAPDEVAVVESSAELMARVESLRPLRDMLGPTVSPPDPDHKEVHLDAALELFDELFPAGSDEASEPATGGAGGSPGGATVTSFEEARDRRRPRRTGLIAAAAAALLLFVGITALSVGSGNNQDDLADVASDAIAADEASETSDDAGDDPVVGAAELNAASNDAGAAMAEAAPVEADAARAGDDTSADSTSAGADEADDGDATDAQESEGAGFMADDLADDTTEDRADADVMADEEAAAEPEAPAPQATRIPDGRALYLGTFDTVEDLEARLLDLAVDEIDERRRLSTPDDLFPSCQRELERLDADDSTLVAEAMVGKRPLEVHVVPTPPGDPEPEPPALLIVEATGCMPLSTVVLDG